ncbi:MAG: DUF58 domain-containing protein [Deltaproteobacteria bacterium]|nr:DUF58 domain-containing protein [Deltaproteobacteria bacterium]
MPAWERNQGTRRSLLRTPIYELAAYRQFVRAWRERFTVTGRRALVTMMVLGVLAIDTRRNQTFLLFAIAAGLYVAALIMVRVGRPRARMLLPVPARATVGEPLPVRGRVVMEEGQGALLRATFGGVVDPQRFAIEPDEVIVGAEPGAETEVRFVLHPKRRGRYELGRATLRPLDPFGFVAGATIDSTRGAHVILVAPPVFRWELRSGVLGRRLNPGGIPLASSTSDAMELIGTREWRPGDRLRNVHWRSFARRGTPIVKEFQEEYFPRIAIVVDTHLDERATPEQAVVDRAAFEASLSVAGSLAAALAQNDHVVELLAAGPELYRVAAGRGLGQLESVLDVLACVEPSDAAPLANVAPAVEDEIARIGTVVAVLLDWDDARAAFLERMRALGAEVFAVVVRERPTTTAFVEGDELERMTPAAVAAALKEHR